MTLQEIYEHYQSNWAFASRELKIGTTTIQKWKKRGYIPIRSQMVLEKRTKGIFKARLQDAKI